MSAGIADGRGRKLAVIGGAGVVGSSVAFNLAARGLADEVVLIDLNRDLARAHAMDLVHAVAPLSHTHVRAGEYADLADCAVAIMCASGNEAQAPDRLLALETNVSVVRTVAAQIAKHCPDATVVNATNPVDVFNYVLMQFTGLPEERFIGFSRNDSLRFRWAIGEVLGVPIEQVDALVIGEHGADQVPLFSSVRIEGAPACIAWRERARITELVQGRFAAYTALQSGRTSGWTSGVSMAELVARMLSESHEIEAVSVIPRGEYGLRDVSVGLPATLCSHGVRSIAQLELAPEESGQLEAAASKIRHAATRACRRTH